MGDIALRTAQEIWVRKAICRAALSALSGDFVLVGQVLPPPRPCLQLACVTSGPNLPLRDSRMEELRKNSPGHEDGFDL